MYSEQINKRWSKASKNNLKKKKESGGYCLTVYSAMNALKPMDI